MISAVEIDAVNPFNCVHVDVDKLIWRNRSRSSRTKLRSLCCVVVLGSLNVLKVLKELRSVSYLEKLREKESC